LYNKRQEIIEHIFGTIKRPWGYTYTLLRGLQKVDGEMGLIFTAYNLRRSMYIFEITGLLKLIQTWKGPNYKGFSSLFRLFASLILNDVREIEISISKKSYSI
jgi:hypothetical protein